MPVVQNQVLDLLLKFGGDRHCSPGHSEEHIPGQASDDVSEENLTNGDFILTKKSTVSLMDMSVMSSPNPENGGDVGFSLS